MIYKTHENNYSKSKKRFKNDDHWGVQIKTEKAKI